MLLGSITPAPQTPNLRMHRSGGLHVSGQPCRLPPPGDAGRWADNRKKTTTAREIMKAISITFIIANCLTIALVLYHHVTLDRRIREAAKAILIDDAKNFHKELEAEIIARNAKKFNAIYTDLGMKTVDNPQSVNELIRPLIEIAERTRADGRDYKGNQGTSAQQGDAPEPATNANPALPTPPAPAR